MSPPRQESGIEEFRALAAMVARAMESNPHVFDGLNVEQIVTLCRATLAAGPPELITPNLLNTAQREAAMRKGHVPAWHSLSPSESIPAPSTQCVPVARRFHPVSAAAAAVPTHYGQFREVCPSSPMIKDASLFVRQGGLVEEWGKGWEPIYGASSIGDARRIFARSKNVTLSPLYDDEDAEVVLRITSGGCGHVPRPMVCEACRPDPEPEAP